MGWWKQEPTGESFADRGDLMWGDEPADAIDVALRGVVEAFQRDLRRPPRMEEILAGVRFSAGVVGGIVLASGVRYCECESPVMDPMHDEGCRRCGLPVNFAPQTQTITHPDDVGDHVMSGPLTGGLFDLRVTPAQLRAAEIIDRVRTALAYLEDGARETGLVRLREVVHAAGSDYRPLVDLTTGREAVAIGSALVDGFERLEPTDREGVYRASDGSEWVGCSDGIWRSGAAAGRAGS